jgi:hypothetical protein
MKPLATVVPDDDTLFDDAADPDELLLDFDDDAWDVELMRALLAPEPARKAA